jgi:hypothetical protein
MVLYEYRQSGTYEDEFVGSENGILGIENNWEEGF